MGHISRCTLTVNVAVSRLGSTPAMDLETLDQRLEGWARFEGDGASGLLGGSIRPRGSVARLAALRIVGSCLYLITPAPGSAYGRAQFLPS